MKATLICLILILVTSSTFACQSPFCNTQRAKCSSTVSRCQKQYRLCCWRAYMCANKKRVLGPGGKVTRINCERPGFRFNTLQG